MSKRNDLLSKIKQRDEMQQATNQEFVDAVVPLSEIIVKEQIRTTFSDESIENLAKSIKSEGLLNPVILHELSEDEQIHEGGVIKKYRLVAGERRYRAVILLGHTGIKARVKRFADAKKIAVTQIIENIQREDLTPFEKAVGFAEILKTQWFPAEEKVPHLIILSKCISELNKSSAIEAQSSDDLTEETEKLGVSLRSVIQYLKMLAYPGRVLDIIRVSNKIGPRMAEDFFPYRDDPSLADIFAKYENGLLDTKDMQKILLRLREGDASRKTEPAKEVRIYQKVKSITKQFDSFLERNLKYRDRQKVMDELTSLETKIKELKERLI